MGLLRDGDIEGPKGTLKNLRLVARTALKYRLKFRERMPSLGLRAPIRESGDLVGSSGVRVIGPKGSVEIKEGAVISRRHIHLSPSEAQSMGLKNGEVVRVRAGIGEIRELVFEQVLCRVSDKFSLEFHIDTDEAHAAGAKNGDTVFIV